MMNNLDGKKRWVLLIVTWLSFIYYGFIAPKEYTSKSVFVVKTLSDDQQALPGFELFSAVQTNPITPIIKAFIATPELFDHLDKEVSYREHLSSLSGLAEIFNDVKSIDYYWKKAGGYITLETKESEDVLVLMTVAYNPQVAELVNASSILAIRGVVERINQEKIEAKTANAKALSLSSELALESSRSRLVKLRESINSANPVIDQTVHRENIASLESELMEARTNLATSLEFLSEKAPQIQSIKNKISALNNIIAQERRKSVGMVDNLDFEAALFDVELLKKSHQFSLAAFEQLRLEALRHSITVIEISAPTLSLKQTYPKLLFNVTSSVIVFFALFFLLSLIHGQVSPKRKK